MPLNKLTFKSGIVSDITPYSNEGGFVDGDKETVDVIESYLSGKTNDNWYYTIDYSPERRGALWSWNYALSLTTGDILFPSGDDQLFYPGWLDRALEYHDEFLDGYGMVAVNDKLHNGNGEK